MYSGPHIKRDGLVFGYDTGYGIADNSTATRFYKGANITNTSNTTAISTYWNNSGTAAWSSNDTEVPRLFSDLPVFSMEKLTNGNSHIGLGTTSATVSTVYTYSIYIWIKPGNSTGMSGSSPYFRPQPANTGIGTLTYNGSSSWNTWPRGRWIRISKTATTPTNVTSAYISCYLNTAGDKVYFTAPQFTSKNFLSPFVNGTRSSTQSLIDLTKTTNIDVSNVSFDSTGQPTFDGTDDGILISTTTNLSSYSALTYEGVVKGAGIGAYDRWFSGTSGTSVHYPDLAIDSSGLLRYLHSSFSTPWVSTGVSIVTNKYNHIVFTFQNNGNTELFLNGSSVYTASHNSGTFPSVSRFMIGSRYDRNGEAIVGQIPVMKIYSRALSPQEVNQNFRAYKNRFGL